MDGDAETLGVASSLGIAGEDGRFATRMTNAFTDFSLGKGEDGTDRGRSLRVSTRQLVSGPSARAGFVQHVPKPPPRGPEEWENRSAKTASQDTYVPGSAGYQSSRSRSMSRSVSSATAQN